MYIVPKVKIIKISKYFIKSTLFQFENKQVWGELIVPKNYY